MHGRGHAALAATIALAVAQGAATGASAVDGVIEINQARAEAGGVTASDTPGFPVTLDAAGSYRLTGNLESSVATSTIVEVTASGVSIDLNGFEIRCVGDCWLPEGSGIEGSASVHDVSVSNGRIVDVNGDGIRLPGRRASVDRVRVAGTLVEAAVFLGSHCRITDSRFGSGQHGGTVGDHCFLRGVLASQGSNGGGLIGGHHVTVVDSEFSGHSNLHGLALGDHASVVNVTANGNADAGIVVGAGSTVRSCRANNNLTSGIEVVSGIVTGNTVEGNNDGILVSGSSTVESNTVIGSGDVGIEVQGDSTVLSNTVLGSDEEGLRATAGTGYGSNVFNDNNGGNANPQVSGGIEIGPNVCGGDTTCP